jgi:hypothetical protein
LELFPELLPLKLHSVTYFKAMAVWRPNGEADHSPQSSVKVQNA